MAYTNVTPPAFPAYDAAAYPHYIVQFEYAEGAENWEIVRLRYSATPFTYDGTAITNAGEHHLHTYGTGTGEWTYWGTLTDLAVIPGAKPDGAGYLRVYTNHAILDSAGAVYLAADTVTPLDEVQREINKKSQLAGVIAAWCTPVQFPQREPTIESYLESSDGYTLQDVNENNLIPKEDE